MKTGRRERRKKYNRPHTLNADPVLIHRIKRGIIFIVVFDS